MSWAKRRKQKRLVLLNPLGTGRDTPLLTHERTDNHAENLRPFQLLAPRVARTGYLLQHLNQAVIV